MFSKQKAFKNPTNVKIEDYCKLQHNPYFKQAISWEMDNGPLGMVPRLDQAIFIASFATPDHKHLLVYGCPPQELTNNYYLCVICKVFKGYIQSSLKSYTVIRNKPVKFWPMKKNI